MSIPFRIDPANHRCGARLPGKRKRHCRRWATPGHTRCKLHGSKATGPLTPMAPEGIAKAVARMVAGRARWLAKLKAEGKPYPAGRRKGGRNRSPGARERKAMEKEGKAGWRQAANLERDARKARATGALRARAELADLEARRLRFHAGLPFWPDAEQAT